MAAVTLHYIYDPLCGWCYGAAPLAQAAHAMPGVNVVLHGGGMMTGSNRRQVTPQWHDYVLPYDQRIAELTGQPYFDKLLRDTSVVLDSAPPTAAVIAAERIANKGYEMLHHVQRAHYEQGRKIADVDVLTQCASEIGLDSVAFANEYAFVNADGLEQHFKESRALLAKVGGHGFPTFVLETADGNREIVQTVEFLGNIDAWRAFLQVKIGRFAA
ncbi:MULTISPECIES: DsbA family protein [Symbiopectobacterium]|uniref:DsbA family protein n=1 Tax=Symbiopectobacterium TaxID=801 RepID=UPI001A31132F|nr:MULTISPECIES: DsbA family protein [Symbiopectobacterium]MBG6248891.1 DsbA family protein [Candidatus Symbiopectobacterium sp. PLON1]MBT9430318.1 DsbA family protein [Candidatus Symbiopectobacterium endolongispinus]